MSSTTALGGRLVWMLCLWMVPLLPSLAVAAPPERAESAEARDARLLYLRCNDRTARLVAPLAGEIASLAIAARGMCEDAYLEFFGKLENDPFRRATLEYYRDHVYERNITEIVRERLRLQGAK